MYELQNNMTNTDELNTANNVVHTKFPNPHQKFPDKHMYKNINMKRDISLKSVTLI